MRTPADEARRIVDELGEQAGIMDERLHSFPKNLFRIFCAVDGLPVTVAATALIIKNEPAYAALQGYWIAVLHACAHAADGTRLPGDAAWGAIVDAQRQAGVALALFVSSAEAREAKKALARHAKEAQTKINDAIRLHVLNSASRLTTLKTPSSAAANIAGKLDSEPGGLAEALKRFESGLKADSAERVFAGYIRKDVDRLIPLNADEKLTPAEKRDRFEQWKKLYVSPAND